MSVKATSWVWEHAEASGTELVLLLAIADFADDNGHAWPSRTTLAAKARLDERTVQRAIKRLEANGSLRVTRGHGRSNSNRYTVVMHREKAAQRPVSGATGARQNHSRGTENEAQRPVLTSESEAQRPVLARESEAQRPVSQEQNEAACPEKGALRPEKGGAVPPEPSGTVKEPSEKDSPATDRFDDFWVVYPRRKAKQAARKAWRRVIASGVDPETLIAAAHRYANARRHQDPQYTAHPATWLNQGRWEDEPDPPPLRLVSHGGHEPFRNPTDPSVYAGELR